jgi:hypothetical protein
VCGVGLGFRSCGACAVEDSACACQVDYGSVNPAELVSALIRRENTGKFIETNLSWRIQSRDFEAFSRS